MTISSILPPQRIAVAFLLLLSLVTDPTEGFSQSSSRWNSNRFGFRPASASATGIRYRSSALADDVADVSESITLDSAPIAVDGSFYEDPAEEFRHTPIDVDDPSLIEFADSSDFRQEPVDSDDLDLYNSPYPLAAMMQTSARYIASHAGQVAVFHLSGDLLERESTDNIISDMALAWLLGMKLVLVVGCRYDMQTCDIDQLDLPHECHNVLKVTDADTLRRVEEEAGYLRTEVERKLNRFLRMHGGGSSTPDAPEGNVVSGNFYTANTFGVVKGRDYEYTGCVSQVHSENIDQCLNNNDVVLLTTVGYSPLGELVNVNGYHLAANVAASLGAYKLVYMANEGSVLRKKGEDQPMQEVPLSFAKALTDYHNVTVHKTGFATFELARQALEPCATELLLHLGWASYALQKGVQRAHIVNPGDGALLEELFTSKNGANTCLYRDEEKVKPEVIVAAEDWNEFFADSAAQGQDVASFS